MCNNWKIDFLITWESHTLAMSDYYYNILGSGEEVDHRVVINPNESKRALFRAALRVWG